MLISVVEKMKSVVEKMKSVVEKMKTVAEKVKTVAAVKRIRQFACLVAFMVVTALFLDLVNFGQLKREMTAPFAEDDRTCLTPELFAENLESVCLKREFIYPRTYAEKNGTVIPKRLHQTFSSNNIPEIYHEHIRSWMTNHPDWEYYFWTNADAEHMIRDRYPQYAKVFQNYSLPLLKSDAIRYFILHQYGGVYCDMDVASLKPIESFLSTNSCIVVPEPYVQTRMIFNYSHTLTNCILASVPNHPFLDLVLRNLNSSNRPIETDWDILRATGSFLLNSTHNQYIRTYHCRPGSYCHVYVAGFSYLVPTFDLSAIKSNSVRCRSSEKSKLGYYNIIACRQLISSKFANRVSALAFTKHLWLHIGWFPKEKLKTKRIEEIVPGALRYDVLLHK